MTNRDSFISLMYKLYDYEQISRDHDSIPRDFGIDQKVYINEAHTLKHIYLNEGVTISELAQIENKTLSALSQKIKKLHKKGLIRKERDVIDYKKFNLYVTKKGKTVCSNKEILDKTFFDNVLEQIQDWASLDYGRVNELIDIINQGKLDEIAQLKNTK